MSLELKPVAAGPPTAVERLGMDLVVVVAAVGITKLLTLWLFSGFAPMWMIAVAALVPAGLVLAWAVSWRRRPEAIALGAVALAACLAVAVWSWVPEPAYFGQVRAHLSADTAVAEHMDAALTSGQCRPTNQVELGPLASLGPWAHACIFRSPTNPNFWSFSLEPPQDSTGPSLTYSTAPGPHGGPCVAAIGGGWSTSTWANDGDPTKPCPHGYSFAGEG
jgi:hypothetical protein